MLILKHKTQKYPRIVSITRLILRWWTHAKLQLYHLFRNFLIYTIFNQITRIWCYHYRYLFSCKAWIYTIWHTHTEYVARWAIKEAMNWVLIFLTYFITLQPHLNFVVHNNVLIVNHFKKIIILLRTLSIFNETHDINIMSAIDYLI